MAGPEAADAAPLTVDELVAGITALIQDGALDRYLERLAEAIDLRRREQDRQKLGSFRVGDRVRLSDRVRPSYLAGAEGVVTEILHKRLLVRLETPVPGKRIGRDDIACPPSVVERLAPAPRSTPPPVSPRLRALLEPMRRRPG
jgi:hypothetical protein